MTRHDDTIRLRHMLDHAREAVKMAEGKERSALRNDRILELAVIRLIENVGEAAVKVSIDGKAKFSSLPWPQIIATQGLTLVAWMPSLVATKKRPPDCPRLPEVGKDRGRGEKGRTSATGT